MIENIHNQQILKMDKYRQESIKEAKDLYRHSNQKARMTSPRSKQVNIASAIVI